MAAKTKTKSDASETLLTVANVAQLDACSEKTVRRAIASGLLSALRVGPGGRLLRVTQGAHEQYRRAQRL